MPDSAVSVRRASHSDVHAIAAFNLAMAMETESLRLDPYTLERGVAAVLRDASKGHYFVAELEGRTVGCLLVTKEWSDWRNCDLWWVQSVYVHPDARRRGVFRSLYETMRAEAKAAGVKIVRLYVEEHNDSAQKTYVSLGMQGGKYRIMQDEIA